MVFSQGKGASYGSPCTKSVLWLRGIANGTQLSNQAKVGLISAGAVTLTFLLFILIICLSIRRRKALRAAAHDFGSNHEGGLRIFESGIYANPRDLWVPSSFERDLLQNHQNTVAGTHIEIQNITNTTIANEPPSSNSIGEASRTIRCEVAGCLQSFTSRSDYNHHMRYHEKPEKCSQCDRSFGTITHLNRHINDVHNTTEKYFCTTEGCKYAKTDEEQNFFSRKDNWRRHMLRHEQAKEAEKHGDEAEGSIQA